MDGCAGARPKRGCSPPGHRTTIPDGVLPATRINLQGRPTFRLDGAYLEVIGPESFLEVKALKRPITSPPGRDSPGLHSRPWRGSARAPASFPAPWSHHGPALLLVTPADTPVSEEVAREAGRRGVAVYQAIAREAGGSSPLGLFAS